MHNENTVWFGIDEILKRDERDFVCAVLKRAKLWTRLGLSSKNTFYQKCENSLILAVDLVDQDYHAVLRTLCADYDESRVVVGPDPTGQLVGDIDTRNEGTIVRREAATPDGTASVVADWIEGELRRPIERHEWDRSSWRERFKHRRWVMADTGTVLCWSDSSNQPRSELGVPDRVIVARDFRNVT